MGEVDVIKICREVLARLVKIGYEKQFVETEERLIFPNKEQAKGDVKRISEQELRVLFIEEFKKGHPDLFYSIETPTKNKYKFGKSYQNIVDNVNTYKISALIDMCVFEKGLSYYNRLLNIEFKHKNTSDKNFGKDILKLIREKQNGAFILLLNNTDKGTLKNKNNTGVFDKLFRSFNDFRKQWSGNNKYIKLVLISREQNIMIYRKLTKSDFKYLNNIFFIDEGCGNIKSVIGNGWKIINIEVEPKEGVVIGENIKYGKG